MAGLGATAGTHPPLELARGKSGHYPIFLPNIPTGSKIMTHIVPKSKAPGTNFCGTYKYYYIIHSNLGCYMRSTNFNLGLDLEVFSLQQSCRGGDHYLAHEDDLFYIIKGNSYRRVSNMNKDEGAIVYRLHPNCHGGDHYLSAFGHFYIIFLAKGVYRRVTNLNTDKDAVEYTLHPECQNGLYYWGTKDYCYFVKPHDDWGVQYYRCTDLNTNTDGFIYSFSGSVVPFIPGGLAIRQGVAFGQWEAIKTITNDSNSPIVWEKKITKKVGYTKQKMSSVEHNWKISMGASYHSGALTEEIVKAQFSLSTEYGGKSVSTEQEDWGEARVVEESINVTLQPQAQIHIWQYQLGLGKEPVLFCLDTRFTDNSTPPTTIPLPPSCK